VESLFSRRGGEGWLVLCGSLPTFGGLYPDLAGRLLDHLDLSMAAVVLYAADADRAAVRALASDMKELLEREIAIGLAHEAAQVWDSTGLVALCGGPAEDWVDAIRAGEHADLTSGRVGEGTVVLAAGPAAAAAGSWLVPTTEGRLHPGLSWLPGAIVLPGESQPASVAPVREWLAGPGRVYAIGLPEGAALALGPAGKVGLWGSARPTIALGQGWRSA
jgi:hypothetical protein